MAQQFLYNPITNRLDLTGTGGGGGGGGNFTWTDKSTTFTPTVNNAYFCTGVLTVNLPASPTQGDTIVIYVDSASVVTIQANTGQTIQIGAGQSTSAGTASSTAEGSTLTLVYRTADLEWHGISVEGTWTLG